METTTCPYCGKEILEVAKKCKHCGMWIEKKCPHCGEWIKADAMKCRYCGSWLNKFAKDKYERENNISSIPSSTDNNIGENIEDAMNNYEENSDAGCLMKIECLLIIVMLGLCYRWMWWKYFIAVAIGYTLLSFRILRILYCIGISILWGIIGLFLAPLIIDDSDWEMLLRMADEDFADYWWVALLFGGLSLLLHWPAMKSRFNL